MAERLSWGIDANCRSKRSRTPLMANVVGNSPNAATVRALLTHGADPQAMDLAGLTALDYARRKLARLQAKPRQPIKSPSLDENDQLRLSVEEQKELDQLRKDTADDPEFVKMWWRERLRAAQRTFNDVGEVERIVESLEAAG